MSGAQIALLGAIAGFTIYLGLPIGRLRNPAPRTRGMLNALATGILIFLLWDVLAHAWEPVDGALSDKHFGKALVDGIVMIAAVGVSLLGLVHFDQWVARRSRRSTTTIVTAALDPVPVSTMAGGSGSTSSLPTTPPASPPPARGGSASTAADWRTGAAQLAMLIAVGIGLHNFAEGLAIGNSAASGEIALAVMLIIGFGLHNATEGFGIVAPMASAGVRPSWGYLGVLGLIGGGPTFIGTLVGQRFTSDVTSILFLGLAAGSILYVVIELLAIGRKTGLKHITTWGIFIGLLLGFLTDAIVTAAGA
jgi:ZIP family zinc transporter